MRQHIVFLLFLAMALCQTDPPPPPRCGDYEVIGQDITLLTVAEAGNLQGGNWTKYGWNHDSDPCECNWYGVECNAVKEVVEIHLGIANEAQSYIGGALPTEVCLLTGLVSLRKLSIASEAGLDGTLPTQLFDFSFRLTELSIDGGGSFYGNLSFLLAQLTTLRRLNIKNTGLAGTIPFGLQALAELEEVDFTNNNFEGTIPADFGNPKHGATIHHLEYISLRDNYLSGSIPDGILSSTSLEHLDLAANYLEGKIPEIILQRSLKTNFLSENRLETPLPWVEAPPSFPLWSLGNNQLCCVELPAWCDKSLTGPADSEPPVNCALNCVDRSETCQGYKCWIADFGGNQKRICEADTYSPMACNDGNIINGDGCSRENHVELGWSCQRNVDHAGQALWPAIICHPIIGDSMIVGNEQCDDGNRIKGDGCSAWGQVEEHWRCAEEYGFPCEQVASHGSGFFCNDGNGNNGDGCSRFGDVEIGWVCALHAPGPHQCSPIVGDGIKTSGEECEDKNIDSGDGCSSRGALELGWLWNGTDVLLNYEDAIIASHLEACADNNRFFDDGCYWGMVEPGWVCPTIGAPCIPKRGDMIKRGNEECDDGNFLPDDGCSPYGRIEEGWFCHYLPVTGCEPINGDGLLRGAEECDDRNIFCGDGCCSGKVEAGKMCTWSEPSVCHDAHNVGSTCWDLNQIDGDGCGKDNKVELGWVCSPHVDYYHPTFCVPIVGDFIVTSKEECDFGNPLVGHCDQFGRLASGINGTTGDPIRADGIVRSGEECDDGNLRENDGCSSTGVLETGWECILDSSRRSICTPWFGDGFVAGNEVCDGGDMINGNGCDSNGKVEPIGWWYCEGGYCERAVGHLQPCWDDNENNLDGCDWEHKTELGWVCSLNSGGRCREVIGDDFMVGSETCWDSNTINNDGCDNNGKISLGWDCGGIVFSCWVIHGDGLVAGDEVCDSKGGIGCEQGDVSTGYECAPELPSVCSEIPDAPLPPFCEGMHSIWKSLAASQ